ncbi:MAG: OsmC family protein [Nakamurella sp.]
MTVDTAADSRGSARTDGLWAERVGTRLYTGHNSRGAEVRMGPVEAGDVFTPGELLKIALAGCAGMSSDHTLARHLGADAAVTVHVAGIKHPAEERYPALHEELVADLSGLDPAALDRVLTVVKRAIDRNCTVGRTLEHSTDVSLTISDASPAAATPPLPVAG